MAASGERSSVRLATHLAPDGPRLGIVHGPAGREAVLDAETVDRRAASMEAVLQADDGLLAAVSAAAEGEPGDAVPLRDVRLLAPLSRPGKLVAVGRNYREHAAEEGATLPSAPVLFTKYPSSITGPGSEIRWRAADTSQVDYEAELGVVIKRRTRDVSVEDALDSVFGYTCLNDVSARDMQVQDGQWVRAKSLDTFCPMGPWIVTGDEIPDPGRLSIRCTVNGDVRQDASTADLIHGVDELIAFCSRFFTLEPGDVIATGTPGGVGAFRVPPVFLADGDVVAVSIEGIGTLENRCRVDAGR
jgi:2-keto-4-pentenoate hydratase/2-oxohepta-3-ene-1,7-dioic acid hydratase in catechol pathway